MLIKIKNTIIFDLDGTLADCSHKKKNSETNGQLTLFGKPKDKQSNRTCKFGVPLGDYDAKWQEQEFCLICGDKLLGGTQTHLDHSHTTGKIRGFLCDACNKGLGYFKDNSHILKEAIWYLENT